MTVPFSPVNRTPVTSHREHHHFFPFSIISLAGLEKTGRSMAHEIRLHLVASPSAIGYQATGPFDWDVLKRKKKNFLAIVRAALDTSRSTSRKRGPISFERGIDIGSKRCIHVCIRKSFQCKFFFFTWAPIQSEAAGRSSETRRSGRRWESTLLAVSCVVVPLARSLTSLLPESYARSLRNTNERTG